MRFKDDINNKMNLQKKLDDLMKNKDKGNFDLLEKEGNPILAKMAINIKQKIDTQRSNILKSGQ